MATPAVILSGKLKDLTGAANAGRLTFTLCNFGDTPPLVQDTAVLADITQTVQAAADGSFSVALWGNDQLAPAGTFYQVEIDAAEGAQVMVASYLFNSGTFDLSSVAPLDTTTGVPIQRLPLITTLAAYANNAAALAAGLKVNEFYRTGGDPDLVCVVH